MTFQRARSDEQREVRRRAILQTAAGMLDEMGVAELTLNELSRRVGLAKSNVLRYFESREAVLLELLGSAASDWLLDLEPRLEAGVDAGATAQRRAEEVAAILTATLVARPVLCELFGAQAAVLERNLSAEVAAGYKRGALGVVATLSTLVQRALPELDGTDAGRFAAAALLVTGAAWTHAQPTPAMLEVYATHPDLAALRLDFGDAVQQLLVVLLAGLLAQRAASAG